MAKDALQTVISVTDGFSKNFILFEKRIHHSLGPLKKLEHSMERLKRVSRFDLFKQGWSDLRKNSKDFILNIRNIGQSFGYVKTAAFGVVNVLDKVASRGDDIAKTSRRLGLSVESLQKFRHAADLAGVPVESMQESLRKMAVGAVRASYGVEKESRAFKALKVSVKNADGTMKNSEQLLLDISDRFANAGLSATEKLFVANEVFGKSGSKMIELLNQGPDLLHEQFEEMVRLGLITEKDAKASEDYNDALARMRRAIEGVEVALASDLLGPMTDAVEYLTNFLKDNKEVFKKTLEPFVKSIPTIVEHATKALPGLFDAFVWLAGKVDWFVDHFGVKFPIITIITANVIAPFGLALLGIGKMMYVVGRAIAALVLRFFPMKTSVLQVSNVVEKSTQKVSVFRSGLNRLKSAGVSTAGVFKKLTSTLFRTGKSFDKVAASAQKSSVSVTKSGSSALAMSGKLLGALAALDAAGSVFEKMTDKENERYKNLSGGEKFGRVVLDVFEDLPVVGGFLKGIENLSVDKVDFSGVPRDLLAESMNFEDSDLFDAVAETKTITNNNHSTIDVNFNGFPKNTEIKRHGYKDPSFGYSMNPAF